jgi:hypothetical protein
LRGPSPTQARLRRGGVSVVLGRNERGEPCFDIC